jgi:hypothetical protein
MHRRKVAARRDLLIVQIVDCRNQAITQACAFSSPKSVSMSVIGIFASKIGLINLWTADLRGSTVGFETSAYNCDCRDPLLFAKTVAGVVHDRTLIQNAARKYDFLPAGGGEPHGYDEFIASVDTTTTRT